MEDDFDSLNIDDNEKLLNDDSDIDLDNIDIKKKKVSTKNKGGRKTAKKTPAKKTTKKTTSKKSIKGRGKKKEELTDSESENSDEEDFELKDDESEGEKIEEDDDIDDNNDADENNLTESDEDDDIDDVFDKDDNDDINTLLTDDDEDTKTTLTTGTTNTFKLINDAETVKSNNPETIITNKNNYITRPFLTRYEYVRILEERTQQIESGAKIMLKIPTEELLNYEPEELTMLELKYKVCPIKIVRSIGSTTKEIWDVNELENIWV